MYQCAAPSVPAYAQAGEEKGDVIKTFDPPQRISAIECFASDGHRWLRFTEQDQNLFAPLADSEGRPLWQPCTDTPKGVTNAERGKRYQCDAPYAPVYAKASENKGPPVKTLGRRQCIEAKELRSDDGRRWLRFTDDRGQRLFTPWADVEGRPLWTPQGERPTAKVRRALATTPLMTSVNRTAEHDDDRTRCYLRDCQHCAQFKCERCERFICLKHHVKYRSGYRSYDYCPPCADRTRRLVLIALALAVVVLAAGGLVICLITR